MSVSKAPRAVIMLFSHQETLISGKLERESLIEASTGIDGLIKAVSCAVGFNPQRTIMHEYLDANVVAGSLYLSVTWYY